MRQRGVRANGCRIGSESCASKPPTPSGRSLDFKEKNNIVDSGGRLMNEQQLAELNSALIQSRAQTAEAKARLERIDDIIRMEVPDATVTDTLRNEVITKLRSTYLDYKRKEADISTATGATISRRSTYAIR